ncbi:MAG: hypothetical protein ACRDRK_20155, partial [Pseudonocardia sp.]
PRPRHPPAMDATWTLAVLPSGVENFIPLADGREPTAGAAAAAAVETLCRCAAALGEAGRQEYHLTVENRLMIVMPGRTTAGAVDLDALRETWFPVRGLTADQRR